MGPSFAINIEKNPSPLGFFRPPCCSQRATNFVSSRAAYDRVILVLSSPPVRPSSPCPQMSHIPQGRMSRTPLFCTRLTLSLKMFLWYLFPQTAFDYKNTKEFVTPASVKLDKERYSSKIDGTVPREYATQLKAQVGKQRSIYLQITDYP